jgi:hypothetical protein
MFYLLANHKIKNELNKFFYHNIKTQQLTVPKAKAKNYYQTILVHYTQFRFTETSF